MHSDQNGHSVAKRQYPAISVVEPRCTAKQLLRKLGPQSCSFHHPGPSIESVARESPSAETPLEPDIGRVRTGRGRFRDVETHPSRDSRSTATSRSALVGPIDAQRETRRELRSVGCPDNAFLRRPDSPNIARDADERFWGLSWFSRLVTPVSPNAQPPLHNRQTRCTCSPCGRLGWLYMPTRSPRTPEPCSRCHSTSESGCASVRRGGPHVREVELGCVVRVTLPVDVDTNASVSDATARPTRLLDSTWPRLDSTSRKHAGPSWTHSGARDAASAGAPPHLGYGHTHTLGATLTPHARIGLNRATNSWGYRYLVSVDHIDNRTILSSKR